MTGVLPVLTVAGHSRGPSGRVWLRLTLAWMLTVSGWLAWLGCRSRIDQPPADSSGSGPVADASKLLFTWEGMVDGRDIIKFRGNSFTVEHESKLPIRGIRFDSRQSLQADHFPVQLKKLSGRGNVDVLKQGDALNRYTLVVRIDDLNIGGAGYYKLAAYSTHPATVETAVLSVYVEVDQELSLEVGGFEVRQRTVGERPPGMLKYSFPLGRAVDPAGHYRLNVVRGRGTVRLMAAPVPREYLQIRVSDPDPGASAYILELYPR